MSVYACKITSGTAESNASSKKLVSFSPASNHANIQTTVLVCGQQTLVCGLFYFSISDLAFRIYWRRTVGK